MVAVVTGAGSGIGAALARELSRAGSPIVLTARRRERLEHVSAECAAENIIVPADLTVETDRRHLVDQTLERFGRIDLLVNNAGLGAFGPFSESTDEQWREMFEINLFAPVFLTRLVLPHMLDRERGTIVNVASIGGLIAHSDRVTAYVAAKHAIVGFTRGLARDLAGTGLKVYAACPHLTDTDFFRASPGAEDMAPVVEQYRSFMDTPEDVARGILAGLENDGPIIFPTDKPARAYVRQRDI